MYKNNEDHSKKSVEVLNLVEIVKYSEGAIVSKTLVDKQAGTLTLFAFDQGQGLSEHTAPFDAVVQVIDGMGQFIIGGQTVQVYKGQLLIMPGNIPHSVNAIERFKMLLTMIRSNEKREKI